MSIASEEFTECIKRILEGIPCQINMTDDILIFGLTEEMHNEILMKVLERLEEADITLNVEKCQFYKRELTFFRLKLSVDGIAPTEDRCKALREAGPPSNAKELRSLLGLVQYNARFIRDTCSITESLWRLTKKNVAWTWTEELDTALRKLKEAITSRCMAFFDKKWQTELTVDASPVGLGAVLAQVNPDNSRDK